MSRLGFRNKADVIAFGIIFVAMGGFTLWNLAKLVTEGRIRGARRMVSFESDPFVFCVALVVYGVCFAVLVSTAMRVEEMKRAWRGEKKDGNST